MGTIRALSLEGPINRTWLIVAAVVALILFVGLGFLPERASEDEVEAAEEFDAFAGGYPVPPMPEQERISG